MICMLLNFRLGLKKSPRLPTRQSTWKIGSDLLRSALTQVMGQGFGGFLGLRERASLIQCSGVSSPCRPSFFYLKCQHFNTWRDYNYFFCWNCPFKHLYMIFSYWPLFFSIFLLDVGSLGWCSCWRVKSHNCWSQWNSIFLAWCNDHCGDCWCSSRFQVGDW